jgi:hypothetical protein
MTDYTTITCWHCGNDFETRENWLSVHETCPDCFEFPDVYRESDVSRDEFSVFLTSRIVRGIWGAGHDEYFRVAARDKAAALWFTEAYIQLEKGEGRSRLRHIVVEDGVANTRDEAPLLSAGEFPYVVAHDGYAVARLASRYSSGDYEDQEYRYGPNTTDQFQNMDPEDYKHVLIHATEEQIDHKLQENVPDDHRCYWTVNGTPRQTRFGQHIWFENDGRIVAGGQIHHTEEGRIWFSPLEQVDLDLPTDPPTRGFTYVDGIELPDEGAEATV